MPNNSFLHNVATAFINNGIKNLKDYCFVFPNRRSGVFFEKELVENCSASCVLPVITTISDFVCDITQIVSAERIELLLDLYEEYKLLIGENCESFDEFCYWGDIILNDFNDVDLYLINPDSIFTNLKEYKEIGTDYLSEEQKDVLREYFGDSAATGKSNIERFWKHSSAYTSNGENTQSYFFLWEMLRELYKGFNKRLEAKGLAYSGAVYRNAVETLKKIDITDMGFKLYIFVGFNVLSTSEIEIFNTLKNKGIGDFYWDCNSPALRDKNNKATRFIHTNIRQFPSKLNLNETPIETFPHIEIQALPGNVGQVKQAADIVEQLINNGQVNNVGNLIDTAIVLPDENLFIPLSGSINPEKVNNVNITMGFPLKKSLIATLLSSISKAHRQSRKIKNEYCFYIEDVKSLLSHPYLKLISSDEIGALFAELANEHPFFIPLTRLQRACPTFKELLDPINKMSVNELIRYLDNILHFISQKVLSALNEKDSGSIEITCTNKYIEQFHQLTDIISKYDIPLNENTFFYLTDRFISGSIVSLQGEPLEGLQIMGVLETRCLDFKNVIVLSMNERVFPRKHFTRSFIPYNIRKGFGMSTIEHQESIYAYYFYRLISRAENVYLLYDARTSGLSSGDPSRYIQQLCQLYTESKATTEYISFDITSAQQIEISVPKTPRVMEKLNQYRTPGSEKYLSASAINSYIGCPLRFYLEQVEELRIDDEAKEFMDAGTFGSIIHSILENIYNPTHTKEPQATLITQDYINSFLKNENHSLDRIITQVVNTEYYKKTGANKNDALEGEAFMLEGAIQHFVTEVLKYDAQQEFTYIQGELAEKGFWDELSINFKQYIDRVDKVDDGVNTPYIRIVDYKSGSDDTKASTFLNVLEQRKKAIMQVFLYCNFYNHIHNTDIPIKPIIYKIKSMAESGCQINKTQVQDYHDFNDDFMNTIKTVINEMFDENIPFTQAQDKNKACKFCKFKDFCRM